MTNTKTESSEKIETIIGGLAPDTKFSKMHRNTKQAQLKNLTSAMAKHISEVGRIGMLVTLTFAKEQRFSYKRMPEEKIIETASIQHVSLMSFLKKMRRSKRIKGDIRYMAVIELQSDGNLHSHIYLSVLESDLLNMLEFIYGFKKQYSIPYNYDGKKAYPIGRLHIGISRRHKKMVEEHYTLKPHKAKSDQNRIEHYITTLESREFKSGNWTPVEFYSENMIEERYEEKIIKYLVKTVDGKYELDEEYIKEGVAKCQLGHDTKTLHDDDHITRVQIAFIRHIGKRIYTHSRLPFPFKLYQKHYRTLVAHDKKCTSFWECIERIRDGRIAIHGEHIFDESGHKIAPATVSLTERERRMR